MHGLSQIIFCSFVSNIFSKYIYLRDFWAAKLRCIEDHSKLPRRESTGHLILHVGTNNLKWDRGPELITKSIVDVNWSMKREKDNVTISIVIIRNDNLIEKAREINDQLKLFCKEINTF